MNRFYSLSTFLLIVHLVVIATLLQACRSKTPAPTPTAPTPTDNKPIITAITFPGIPQRDVTIDQTTRTLTIKVPELIQDDMTPTIQTTGALRVVGCDPKGITLFTRPDECGIGLLEKKDSGKLVNPVVEYKIKLVPTGKLEIQALSGPVRYTLHEGSGLELPLKNLYANRMPLQARFVRMGSGEALTLEGVGFDKGFIFSLQPNKITLLLANMKELLPGTYQLELRTAQGDLVRVPQPVILEAGKAYFSTNTLERYTTPPLTAGTELELEGTNLFEDLITLHMIDSTDTAVPIQVVRFDPYGRRLTLRIPPSFRPGGHYIVRLSQVGVSEPRCYRFQAIPQEFPPLLIHSFGEYYRACSNKGPLQLPRNQAFGVTIPVSDDKLRFKLTSLTDSQQAYYIPVRAYSYTSGQIPPTISIPTQVIPGLYKLTLQRIDEVNNVLAEGPPFWRTLEIQ